MNNNTTDGWYLYSNMTPINSLTKFCKITQLHNGNFLFIDSNLDLYLCDKNFNNQKILSNRKQKFSGVTQLSNYRILLTGINNDQNIYVIRNLQSFNIQIAYNSNHFFTDVKQVYNGKILAIYSGHTYSFDINDDFIRINNTNNYLLKNISLLQFNNNYNNIVSTFIPQNPQTFIFNLDTDNLRQSKIHTYNINPTNNIINPRDNFCIDGYVFDGFTTCNQKCPNGYIQINNKCWGYCNNGDKDLTNICQVPCKNGYIDAGNQSCYYGNGNNTTYPISYIRNKGKLLLYYTGDRPGSELGGYLTKFKLIDGENKVGIMLMKIAGFANIA
jgi:hypothetical protein